MSKRLRHLLEGAIDYAGCFPPASLDIATATANFARYHSGPHAWMLGCLVVPHTSVPDAEDFPLAIVEGLSERQPQADYTEIPVTSTPEQIAAVPGRAKVRTGGLTPDKFPSPEQLAGFILNCARAGKVFKATAGLHHAIRGEYPLSYKPNAPCATMHGFLNLLAAAALAQQGAPAEKIITALETREWQTLQPVLEAAPPRELLMSFGSCSFEEPVAELETLGIL